MQFGKLQSIVLMTKKVGCLCEICSRVRQLDIGLQLSFFRLCSISVVAVEVGYDWIYS